MEKTADERQVVGKQALALPLLLRHRDLRGGQHGPVLLAAGEFYSLSGEFEGDELIGELCLIIDALFAEGNQINL